MASHKRWVPKMKLLTLGLCQNSKELVQNGKVSNLNERILDWAVDSFHKLAPFLFFRINNGRESEARRSHFCEDYLSSLPPVLVHMFPELSQLRISPTGWEDGWEGVCSRRNSLESCRWFNDWTSSNCSVSKFFNYHFDSRRNGFVWK